MVGLVPSGASELDDEGLGGANRRDRWTDGESSLSTSRLRSAASARRRDGKGIERELLVVDVED